MSKHRSPIRTQQEWQHIVQEFYNGGLSSSEFCRLNNINAKTFANIRHKFRNSVERSKETPFIEVTKTTVVERPNPMLRSSTTQPSLRLEVGDGLLHIPLSVTPAWIADLLREVSK